jgi:hypothetical protein
MDPEWILLAELTPDTDGYETSTATQLLARVQEAVVACGEPDDVARTRLVMGDGHTMLRIETCSAPVRERFLAAGGSDPAG